jgi:2-haloacid dehalogenase
VKAVVFDFAGVLKGPSPLFAARLSDQGLAMTDVMPFFRGPDAVENQFGGEPFSTDDMIPVVQAALAVKQGDNARQAAEATLSVYSDSDLMVEIDGMYDLVAELHQAGVKIGLLSNGAVETEGAHLKDLIGSGVVDATVNAGRDGVAKPSNAAFELIAARLGVKIQDCFFVDDAEHNVAAAEQIGMSTFHFQGDVEKLRRALAAADSVG